VDYGEADRIVTLLTETRGKISALARGARKSFKRFGGALEPFALIEVTWAAATRGRGELKRLEEARLLRAHDGLATDLRRIGAASLVLELTREIIPEQEPQPGIFAHLVEVLPLLASSPASAVSRLVLAAELTLLAEAGMGVSVGRCNACGREVPPGRPVRFHPARGGVVCTPCGGGPITLSKGAAAALLALERSPLEDVAAMELSDDVAAEVDAALTRFLEHHLERTLSTRSFYSPAP
jgi:DNA repair protein RecO (recombination protein O)